MSLTNKDKIHICSYYDTILNRLQPLSSFMEHPLYPNFINFDYEPTEEEQRHIDSAFTSATLMTDHISTKSREDILNFIGQPGFLPNLHVHTRVLNKYATSNNILKEKDDSLTGDDVKEGLTMIVSCKHPNPQFEGQTKGRLGNSEVRKIADSVFAEGFERFLLENPDEARIIIDKTMTAARARVAAKRARELTRRKSDLDPINFGGKLVDCKDKDPSVCEIFLVEGDSAGGSAIKGRDSMTQAILPLRGKILNVEKARLDKALANEEIRTIITAFGTGIGDEFDLSKLRYHKIIIMTDADVDGSHIRVLLLTLFYRFFRPIVEAGHVYAAQPPLFCIKHGKTIKYVLNEEERDQYIASLNANTKYDIARMKGLGEMDAEELNETTMDINKRILRKITVDDLAEADAAFSKLMGEDVGPRREFIEENAQYVENLDTIG